MKIFAANSNMIPSNEDIEYLFSPLTSSTYGYTCRVHQNSSGIPEVELLNSDPHMPNIKVIPEIDKYGLYFDVVLSFPELDSRELEFVSSIEAIVNSWAKIAKEFSRIIQKSIEY